jgi:hypothetical protein
MEPPGLAFGKPKGRLSAMREGVGGFHPAQYGSGDPAWIRTRDLQLRRLLLYPLSYGAL